MVHNVLAVYEVLGARISKRKGINPFLPAFAFAGRPKSGGVSRESEGVARPT
jgi:hypothetical protein